MQEDKLRNKKKVIFPELLRLYSRKSLLLDELIFFVTYRCNFRCKTCFYGQIMDDNLSGDRKELNLNEIRKISNSLGKFSKLLISGGEPFLRDDLVEICKIFYSQNKIRTIHLPTNGFDLEKICDYTSKILNHCPEVNLILSLSLDGFSKTHDAIKGVRGSFQKVKDLANKLSILKRKFKNLSLYIITVVNSLNLDEIIELSEFIKNNLPVDNHIPAPMRGLPYDKGLLPPSFKEWENLSRDLMKYRAFWDRKRTNNKLKVHLTTNRVRYLYKIYTRVLKGKKLPFRCQAGKVISVLEPNGEVKLCELTKAIGNVRSTNYDFRKILFSDKANSMRKKIRNCACTHACFLDASIKMNPLTLFKSYFLGF